tara:strand:+ start:1571 stop:2335 length:765 start_codon:yes stop_codon:yes gene_type:complete
MSSEVPLSQEENFKTDSETNPVEDIHMEKNIENLDISQEEQKELSNNDSNSQEVSEPSVSKSQSSQIADNEARLEQLENEHETLKSQYMRIAADFDNFRKRQTRDNDDLRIQLTCNTLGEILPVIDNFERARQQLTPEGEEAQALHRSYQGLYKQLVEVLKKLGVAPMRVVGQKFDPNLHEAVMREPSDIHQEDIITEELQRGYHLDGRVIRHALVKVSMGPGSQNEDSSNPEEKSIEIDDAKDQEPEISKDDD